MNYLDFINAKHINNYVTYSLTQGDVTPFCPITWHEEMEVMLVRNGSCFVNNDGNNFVACAGDVVIFSPFVLHTISARNQEFCAECMAINLRALAHTQDKAAQFAPLLTAKHSVPDVVHPSDSWYNALITSLETVLTGNGNNALYDMFYTVYAHRIAEALPNTSADKRCYTMRCALEYITDNFNTCITISDVARHCGYSEFYMMKLFKKFAGYTVVDYVNNVRLAVIARKLVTTCDDVSQIAYEAGYNNVSYFNRKFLAMYGVTPKQYRKANALT